jgi:hypothetical protein
VSLIVGLAIFLRASFECEFNLLKNVKAKIPVNIPPISGMKPANGV